MDYFVYTAGAIAIGCTLYTVTHHFVRRTRKFWAGEVRSGKLLRNTFSFLLSPEERQQNRLDRDQQYIDELLTCGRDARDQVRSLTQRFADPQRATQALDALPGRTSRQLVDEIAQIELDIANSMGQFQHIIKSAIASWTRGANLLERFEAQQEARDTAARQTTKMGNPTNPAATVIETTGVDLLDNIVYMCRYANGTQYTPLTGAQIVELLRQGKKIGRDFYVMGQASEFQNQNQPRY